MEWVYISNTRFLCSDEIELSKLEGDPQIWSQFSWMFVSHCMNKELLFLRLKLSASSILKAALQQKSIFNVSDARFEFLIYIIKT